jgi:thiol-disulfide isomerase/thioredoxin
MLRLIFVLSLLLLGGRGWAAQIKFERLKVGSVTFSNVTVLGANATDLYFSHSKGVSNVKLKYLEPDLQKQFHYDPKEAAAVEKEHAAEDLKYQNELAATTVRKAQRTNRTNGAGLGGNMLADPLTEKSLLGKQAPALKAEAWIGESPTNKGKCTLYFFFGSWSVPCKRALPVLSGFEKKFEDKLEVVGVSAEPKTELQGLAEQIGFPVAIDPRYVLAKAVGVTSVPAVMLTDRKGKILYLGHPTALNEEALGQLIGSDEDLKSAGAAP